jgi:hypothetical protein
MGPVSLLRLTSCVCMANKKRMLHSMESSSCMVLHQKDVGCRLPACGVGLFVFWLLEPNKVIQFGDFGHPPRQGFPSSSSTRFLCSSLFLFDDTLDVLDGFDIIVSSIVNLLREIQTVEIVIYSPA